MSAPPNSRPTAYSASSTARDCFHCGQPLPGHSKFTATIDGEPRPMCCQGCAAVAQAIVDMGLGHYYRLRTARPAKPQTDHPWPAALGMSASSLLVVVNALRLVGRRPPWRAEVRTTAWMQEVEQRRERLPETQERFFRRRPPSRGDRILN